MFWEVKLRYPVIAAAAVLAPLALLPAPVRAQQGDAGSERSPTSIVLVTVDTLRADFVSFAGHPRKTTPYLDRLAERGVVMERAYAPSSWTAPSMASLFTGAHPVTHGVDTHRRDKESGAITQPELAESFVTLAERLRDAGFVTVGVAANRHLESRLGFAQGFDHYLDEAPFMEAKEVNREVRRKMEAAFGAEWRSQWKERKTFLWIHYFDPHAPYAAQEPWIHQHAPTFASRPQAFPSGLNVPGLEKRKATLGAELEERIKPLYESEINYFDEQFRTLSEELGLADPDVALLVTSDHGEELLDHGDLSHGRTLFEEVIRVPLLVHWPRGLEGGRRVSQMVSLLDVYPTVLALCGLDNPGNLQGRSFAGLLQGGREAAPPGLAFELHPRVREPRPKLQGWTDGRWKIIRAKTPGSRSQLFDLDNDPGETEDLAESHRDTTRRLELALRQWLSQAPGPPSDLRETTTDDEKLKKQLEALGYLGD